MELFLRRSDQDLEDPVEKHGEAVFRGVILKDFARSGSIAAHSLERARETAGAARRIKRGFRLVAWLPFDRMD